MSGQHNKAEIVIRKVFPDAHASLLFHAKSFEEMKERCVFVLDTNVLLVPYTVGKDSLSLLQEKFSELVKDKRLVVPAQVLREFLKNRPLKITEVYQQLQRKLDGLKAYETGTYPLLEQEKEYQDLKESESELARHLDSYRERLKSLIDALRSWGHDDPVMRAYRSVFTKTAIRESDLDDAKLLNDLEWRIDNKIPPAYKDASKADSGIGDLIIWHTILNVGASDASDVVFVTNETKADWWHRSENHTLMPRIELVEEFRRRTQGWSFTMLSLSGLLRALGISSTVVTEIERQDEALMQARRLQSLRTAYEKIGNALSHMAQASGTSIEGIPLSVAIEIVGTGGLVANPDLDRLRDALRFCEYAFKRGGVDLRRFRLMKRRLYRSLAIVEEREGQAPHPKEDTMRP